MASQNQIDANRRNAQHSTGPRSAEGKAASRCNALKSGIYAQSLIIPGEDPAELEALTADYYRQFPPATALERFLVDALIHADWQLRRLRRVEAQLWQNETAEARTSYHGLHAESPLGQVFSRSRDAFTRLQRRIDSTERSYYRALTQLQRLQPAMYDDEDDPPPAPELASFRTIPPPPPPPPNPTKDAEPQARRTGSFLTFDFQPFDF